MSQISPAPSPAPSPSPSPLPGPISSNPGLAAAINRVPGLAAVVNSNPALAAAIGGNPALAAAISGNPALAAAIGGDPELAAAVGSSPKLGAALATATPQLLARVNALNPQQLQLLGRLQDIDSGMNVQSQAALAEAGAKVDALPGGGVKVTLSTMDGKPLELQLTPGKPLELKDEGGASTVLSLSGSATNRPAQSRPLNTGAGAAMATVDLGEGNNTLNAEGVQIAAMSGRGVDTYNLSNVDGTIAAGGGADRINITGDSTVAIEYKAGDLGTSGRRRSLDIGEASPLRGGGTFGRASERDTIAGFSTDDVLRISKAALPGARLRNGALRRSDFAVVEGRGAVNRSNATIVYDAKSGGLFYNPQGPARPVEIIRMESGLDLTRNNIVIF